MLLFTIIVLVVAALYALLPGFRGIVNGALKVIFESGRWFANRIGVSTFWYVFSFFIFMGLIFLLVFVIGYTNNINWLVRSGIIIMGIMSLVMMDLSEAVSGLFGVSDMDRKTTRSLALMFMYGCIICLFAEADIQIFKANISIIAGFTLFCLFFIAAGKYTGVQSNAPVYFLGTIFVLLCIGTIYTHADADRWEIQKKGYFVRRGIKTQNMASEVNTLDQNWKVGYIKEKSEYPIIVTDGNGKVVKKPSFTIRAGSKVLVYSKENPTVKDGVSKFFRELPVFEITSTDLTKRESYWILQANIEMMTQTHVRRSVNSDFSRGASGNTDEGKDMVCDMDENGWSTFDEQLSAGKKFTIIYPDKNILFKYTWQSDSDAKKLTVSRRNDGLWWGTIRIKSDVIDPTIRLQIKIPNFKEEYEIKCMVN